jgi:hypothetical protein
MESRFYGKFDFERGSYQKVNTAGKTPVSAPLTLWAVSRKAPYIV